ncbi:MAG: class I SAM-dependent methyltransferase [Alphaproteobacteria bacterium]|nr:class I SAM-dependent methyltransferase [Alphaproteobacteria bacterium]
MDREGLNEGAAATSNRDGDDATHFGFRAVGTSEKASLVRGVFDQVASRYDLMNDLMSLGVHRLWKAALLDALAPRPHMRLLDMAGGTGDIACRFLARLPQNGKGAGKGVTDSVATDSDATDSGVIVCDANAAMMKVGRARALDRGIVSGLSWVCGDAEAIPLPERSMDAYTIAFGLRNVTHPGAALGEAYRVLKPGGRFLCLEFSHVVLPVLDRLYDMYSFNVIPALGGAVTGDAEGYRYLVESIRRFPTQEALADDMREAGFERVSYRNLSGGIAALHSGWRI